MNERRIDDLLRYLDALTRLKAQGEYLCGKEIGECIAEIRHEIIERKETSDSFEIKLKDSVDHTANYDLSFIPTDQLTDELTRRHPKSVIDTLLERE